ncbi:MAG: hypothetical protein GX352_04670 [Clostridiales bacterium]|nr:hypothetical protein [Clostridiales bacterium]
MINIKKRVVIFSSIIIGIIVLISAVFVWDLAKKSGKKQDKTFQGARLVLEEQKYQSTL